MELIKNASAGNRTRVDSLEGYNSTSKLLMLTNTNRFYYHKYPMQ